MNTSFEDLVYLCSCAVDTRAPDAERVKKLDLPELLRTAEQHMLTAVVAAALESAGVRDRAFIQAGAKAARKAVIMDLEQDRVLSRLEAAGIWYMPMKGAVLKDLYPSCGMRQMSDRDILTDTDRMAEVRDIMVDLGFTVEEYGQDYHDCYFKPPVCNFEMHRKPVGPMSKPSIYSYYLDVQHRLRNDPDSKYGRHFSPEDFYVFMVAHEYNHFTERGTGLRSLLDTYVYLKSHRIDQEYVAAETAKLGISDFEQTNRELALHLFGGNALTEAEQRMLKRFYDAGTYGSVEIRAKNQLEEKGRKGYFLSRLTLPYERMLEMYPVLNRVPMLYPFCWLQPC